MFFNWREKSIQHLTHNTSQKGCRKMKKLSIHIGIGIGLLFLSCLAGLIFEAALDLLDKIGIVGASWLHLAGWELGIGTIVFFILWVISLFGLPFRWHNRFHQAAIMYAVGFLGLGAGVAGVVVPGFISLWFYKNSMWPIGMIFRLVELGACITVLSGLLVWIFYMVYTMFIPEKTSEVTGETHKGLSCEK
jgi:hypothetical protein